MADTAASTETNNTPGQEAPARGDSKMEKYFTDALNDMYLAEKQLIKVLPNMQEAAGSEKLKKTIGEHLSQTKEHVEKLEHVFDLFGKKAVFMNGSTTRDAGMIITTQKVEHFEIASYGGMVQIAKTMGNEEAANILQTILDNQQHTDQALTMLMEDCIDWEVNQEPVENYSKS